MNTLQTYITPTANLPGKRSTQQHSLLPTCGAHWDMWLPLEVYGER
jgi:hypothetical protein